jgi:hypothetical protein
MRLLSACTLALLVATVPAQAPSPTPAAPAPTQAATSDALAAAKQRLNNALRKASGQNDTAFTARWGPEGKKDDERERAMAMFLGGATGGKGKVSGSWHADRMHLRFDGDEGDELVFAGRRTLAKDGKSEWRLRTGRFADGNTIGFAPDMALLLQLLAGWELAVTRHEAGSHNDRPVEILSVTLSPEQVAEAVWTGALPESLVQSAMMGFAMIAGVGGGARPAAPAPTATVDLALQFDPATGVIHQLHFRSWVAEDAMVRGMGAVRIVRAAGAVQVVGGGDDEDGEEEKEEPAADANAPLRYEHGLPLRPRKKTTVNDYVIELSNHGQIPAPELDALQRKLLGR